MSAIFTGITIDNVNYDVLFVFGSLQRTFNIVEGNHAGTSLKYRKIRDIQGTSYTYQFDVEPNPSNRADYDSFYQVISAPTDYHTIIVPFGQSTLSFDAYVESGTDIYDGEKNGELCWKGLRVRFTAIQPVRTN